MTEQMGVVIQNERGCRVRIVANHKSACSGCGYRGGFCRSCLAGADLLKRDAANPAGARTGDLVAWEGALSNSFYGAVVTRVVQPGFRASPGSVPSRQIAAGYR